jgi:hypothetical protein
VAIALAAIMLGLLLVYAGLRGLSFTRLLQGDNTTPDKAEKVTG